MTKNIRSKDCGNSPKNKFVENMEITFTKGDVKFLLKNITEDVNWHIIGPKPIHGKAGVVAAIQGISQGSEVTEIAIHHVAAHGIAGAVNGFRKHKSGNSYDFCTVYEFGNSKGESIRALTHYAIERAE